MFNVAAIKKMRLALLFSVAAAGTLCAEDANANGLRCTFYQSGEISFYGSEFGGRTMANGQRFDPRKVTMAHRDLKIGERVRIETEQGFSLNDVEVTDHGPNARATGPQYKKIPWKHRPKRIADLSAEAARRLAFTKAGKIQARIFLCSDDNSIEEIAEAPLPKEPGRSP